MAQSRVGRRSSRRVAMKERKSLSRGRGKKAFAHGRRKTAMKARTRVVLGKTHAKPRRHAASPATVREIARTLRLTAEDLAAGSALVDHLGL